VEQPRERQLSQQPLAAPCRQRTERLLQICRSGVKLSCAASSPSPPPMDTKNRASIMNSSSPSLPPVCERKCVYKSGVTHLLSTAARASVAPRCLLHTNNRISIKQSVFTESL